MRDRGESKPAFTWRIELTLHELRLIEHALARLSTEKLDFESGHEAPATASLRTRLLQSAASTSSGGPAVPRPGGTDRPAAVSGSAYAIDEQSLTVIISNDRFNCKPISFRLLSHLIDQRGRWIRTDELRRQVLATTFEQDASNVRWHILQARRALGGRANLIHSDNRLGFMFDPHPCARRHCTSPG
jgi:DNA-binding response OmpR family regulator